MAYKWSDADYVFVLIDITLMFIDTRASHQGVITAVGADCPSTLSVGDRVAIEAGQYCKTCERCKEGRYNLCPSMRFASSAKTYPHLDGTLQTYLNWPHWGVHRLPDPISFAAGALMEPLSVVLQSMQRTQLQAKESVLVVGAGAVGLLACAAAKAWGARFVAAVDIDEERLRFAKENGWVDAIHLLPKRDPSHSAHQDMADYRTRRDQEDKAAMAAAKATAADITAAVLPPSTQEGFDVIYECTGVPSCVQSSIFAARPGGRVGLIGMGSPIQTLPIGAAALREVDLIGVFRYANTYPTAIELLSGGDKSQGAAAGKTSANGVSGLALTSIEKLISHRYTLEQAPEAFETLARGKSTDGRGVTKVFVVADEGDVARGSA